jgi:GxxExxY protein
MSPRRDKVGKHGADSFHRLDGEKLLKWFTTVTTSMRHSGMPPSVEAVGRAAVDAGLKVHAALGPGLLESAYSHCLFYELEQRGILVRREAALPIVYDGKSLDAGFRIDLLLAESVILEIKSVDVLGPIHQAQLLTYLRLSGCRLGYLMNFNVELFKHGLRRIVL